jgi:AbrB family looped-hinge helix DNA binding protein
MQTKLSTKGQIVLPGPVRTKLGIRAGDILDIRLEEGRVVLSPRRKHLPKAKIIKSPLTGFSVLDAGPDAPVLTSEEVAAMLKDFP